MIVEEREELGSDSDSEYGFGDRWGGEANTSKAWGPLAKSSAKKNSQRRGKSRRKRVGVSTMRKGEEVSCQWFVADGSNWHWELFFKGPFMAPRYCDIELAWLQKHYCWIELTRKNLKWKPIIHWVCADVGDLYAPAFPSRRASLEKMKLYHFHKQIKCWVTNHIVILCSRWNKLSKQKIEKNHFIRRH